MILFLFASFSWAGEWADMIEDVAPGIVSIHISSNRHFDTEYASSGVATGFVVDKERGIILTNRHVVEPGPVSSYAVLLNNEELKLKPIYRDPVHDFGFYQYNPEDIKYLDIQELELCSTCVDVGTEVRLIGNDSGEKISILPATIARLDRSAPSYGKDKFNDFNTFYIQAAAGSSGGSSGSPVLDKNGRVIALNAGGKSRAASSFFLPLDRVERALKLIQKEEDIQRGTLQATFLSIPYDKALRLGLKEETASFLREKFPDVNGVLALERYNPGGPVDGVLGPSDIIVNVNGEAIVDFLKLEAILDSNVGQKITIDFERGGQSQNVEIIVDDLHAITPSRFVEGCGSIFHNLSYQMSRHYSLPIYGVYLANSGYCFDKAGMTRGNVIVGINDIPIYDITSFYDIIKTTPDNEDLMVSYFSLGDPANIQHTVVNWDRLWFPLSNWNRDDSLGIWSREISEDIDIEIQEKIQETTLVQVDDRVANKLGSSIVVVDFDVPYTISAVYGDAYRGGGLVLDKEKGIIVVDKDTVPIAGGDIEVTFEGDVTVPAHFLWSHPVHNMTLIQYDPRLIGNTPVRSAVLKSTDLSPGDRVWMVGRKYQHELVWKKTEVSRIDPISTPIPRVPFFRDENLNGIAIDSSASSVGGVLSNRKGEVLGLWASFVDLSNKNQDRELFGIDSYYIQQSLDHYLTDDIYTLGAVLKYLSLADARRFGLMDADSEGLSNVDTKRRALYVNRVSFSSPAYTALRVNDIIVKVNGEYTTSLMDVDKAVQFGEVTFEVLRSGVLLEVKVETEIRSGNSTTRVISIGGALIEDAPVVLGDQRGVAPTGAYVSWCAYGAPCSRDELRPTNRIVSVNGANISTLDDFILQLSNSDHTKPLRLGLLSLRDIPKTLTLRLDEHYWPSFSLSYDNSQWKYEEFSWGTEAESD